MHCGKGNSFSIVKFVKEVSFYLHLQLLSQDCVLSLVWRLLLNCIKQFKTLKHQTAVLNIKLLA